jgi:16S rRNA (cytidine1402-2'-O)-methyltransferase
VATPIGNLGDISQRALDTLAAADLVACEDTRVSGPLLRRYGIATPLFAYHEHNAAKVRPELLRRLAAGQAIALIADAGTPLISDPGYKLVRAALAQGSHVSTVPGPSAVMAALCLAGLPTDRFLFAGFPPAKSAARRRALAELAAVRATLVFLESPHRLAESLADMAEVLGGGREAAVARELTKLYEEVRRDSLAALAASYDSAPPPKGEIVVVVGPPVEAPAGEAAIDEALAEALKLMSVREAVAAVAAATGAPRRTVYARALALADAGAGR